MTNQFLFSYGLFNDAVSSWNSAASNNRVIYEQWIGYDMEISGNIAIVFTVDNVKSIAP
jgi:hypothetical protein